MDVEPRLRAFAALARERSFSRAAQSLHVSQPAVSKHVAALEVEIDFQLATSGGALEIVRAHQVEIAVVGGMTVPPELEAEALAEDDVVLVGAPSLGRDRVRPKDLEGLTWISREEGSATRAAVE